MSTDQSNWVNGGCHCGRVAYRVRLPEPLRAQRCNCSICAMTGFVHLIVPAAHFDLRSAPTAMSRYQFNTGVAQHLFCSHCGIKSFYVPRSNPDGYSINLRCLPEAVQAAAEVEDFDGQNWEQHAAGLATLSRS